MKTIIKKSLFVLCCGMACTPICSMDTVKEYAGKIGCGLQSGLSWAANNKRYSIPSAIALGALASFGLYKYSERCKEGMDGVSDSMKASYEAMKNNPKTATGVLVGTAGAGMSFWQFPAFRSSVVRTMRSCSSSSLFTWKSAGFATLGLSVAYMLKMALKDAMPKAKVRYATLKKDTRDAKNELVVRSLVLDGELNAEKRPDFVAEYASLVKKPAQLNRFLHAIEVLRDVRVADHDNQPQVAGEDDVKPPFKAPADGFMVGDVCKKYIGKDDVSLMNESDLDQAYNFLCDSSSFESVKKLQAKYNALKVSPVAAYRYGFKKAFTDSYLNRVLNWVSFKNIGY